MFKNSLRGGVSIIDIPYRYIHMEILRLKGKPIHTSLKIHQQGGYCSTTSTKLAFEALMIANIICSGMESDRFKTIDLAFSYANLLSRDIHKLRSLDYRVDQFNQYAKPILNAPNETYPAELEAHAELAKKQLNAYQNRHGIYQRDNVWDAIEWRGEVSDQTANADLYLRSVKAKKAGDTPFRIFEQTLP